MYQKGALVVAHLHHHHHSRILATFIKQLFAVNCWNNETKEKDVCGPYDRKLRL